MFELSSNEKEQVANIKVVGIGGCGNNAVSRMVESGITSAELIGINTDIQDIKKCKAGVTIPIGAKTTNGLGAGAKSEVGERAAEESADEIAKADDSVALINEKAAAYREMQSSALAAAKRGYVDDIIEACDTRKRVIAAFEMLFTKREDRPDRKHGTV